MSKARKIIAAVLVLCLIFSCFTATAATTKGIVYDSPTSDFTATKVSHPETGYGETDGIVEYPSGDNDRGQSYAWSAVGHGDYIYIGTCYGAIWSTLKLVAHMGGMDVETIRAAANAAFNGKLYVGDPKNNPTDTNRSVILKLNTKTSEVKIIDGPNKFGGYRAAIAFNDKVYFCNTMQTPQIIEIDPATDAKKVVYQCEKANPGVSVGIRGIAVYNGKLIVSMINNEGAMIVASENPSLGQDSFKVIGTQKDLLDYPAYMFSDAIYGGAVFDMVPFNGHLYITVVTGKADANGVIANTAFALFEATENADGTWTYDLLVGNPKDGAKYPYGFGIEKATAANMVVHNGYLYIGAYNDCVIGNFRNFYKDLEQAVNLWRMDKDGNFELVVGDPYEYFPEAKGNMGSGFDNAMNQYVWRMISYNGKLYIGTFDVSSFVEPLGQFTNGDFIKKTPKEWISQIKYIKDFISHIKSQQPAPQAKAIDAQTARDMRDLGVTMFKMTFLLNKGGENDLTSMEKFHSLLLTAVDLYAKVRDYLPASITSKLDAILTEDNAETLFCFIGVCKHLSKAEKGFDLLVTEDGLNFDVITRNGLGDPNNHGLRTFAVNDNGLFCGTANPFFGAQVWHIEENAAAK